MTPKIDQQITVKRIRSPAIDNGTLSLSDCLSYTAPYVIVAWIGAGPIAVVQGIYAKYYGFPLTTLAAIVLLARLFDTVTDPLIGYYSDRYRERVGTRKPFVVFGCLLLMVSAYFLYVPMGVELSDPLAVNTLESPAVSVAYFTGWFLLLYLAYTIIEIPHGSWASELATTSVDKSKIYSFRSMATYLGLVLFYVVPLLPWFESSDITPASLKVSVISACVLLLPLLYVCITRTPNGHSHPPRKTNQQSSSNAKFGASTPKTPKEPWFKSIVRNKPLRIFLSAYLLYGLGGGMWFGLIFLYVDSYLGLGEQFALMYLLAFILGIAATPIWYKLSIILGKKVVLVIAMVLLIASFIYSGMLAPGETAFWELVFLKVINALGTVCLVAIAPAMLSEIIDYSSWKYRQENTGMYYSLFLIANKITGAIGTALGLAIIGWYGYDATAAAQDPEATVGLLLSMVWLPIIFAAIALILITLNPINAHRHSVIRRRLDTLAARAERAVSPRQVAPELNTDSGYKAVATQTQPT